MIGLFDNDEAYQQAEVKKKRKLVRNSSGRFCTEEERETERIRKENAILKRKAEQYKRNWFAESSRATRKDRENHELKQQLIQCKEELKSLRKTTGKRKASSSSRHSLRK